MIPERLKSIHKNQRGFTLVELLVAIAITGLITSGITMAIFQVFNINTISGNQMVVVRQVQNAGYWISRDTQMAQIVDTDGPELVTLSWEEYSVDDDGDEHQVIYTLVGDQLRREHYTNSVLDATTYIAQYIDSIEVAPSPFTTGDKLTLTITAGLGTASETRTYEITPRPNA